MKYMGSKNRIAKHILPIMLKDRKEGQSWVETFVGGANTIDKVDGNRIGADKNKYIIAMWNGIIEDRDRPNEIEKSLYSVARDVYNGKEKAFNHIMEMDDFMIGWIGWMASFNGRFFDGGYSGKTEKRNYIDEQIRNTEKQIDNLRDCKFIHSDYKDLEIPSQSIIYCDPPYKGTKQYSTSKNFCHIEFWEWCRKMSNNGHTVFISEYNAPEDFECIWHKEVTNSMHTTKTTKPTEKLFKLKVTGIKE